MWLQLLCSKLFKGFVKLVAGPKKKIQHSQINFTGHIFLKVVAGGCGVVRSTLILNWAEFFFEYFFFSMSINNLLRDVDIIISGCKKRAGFKVHYKNKWMSKNKMEKNNKKNNKKVRI